MINENSLIVDPSAYAKPIKWVFDESGNLYTWPKEHVAADVCKLCVFGASKNLILYTWRMSWDATSFFNGDEGHLMSVEDAKDAAVAAYRKQLSRTLDGNPVALLAKT